MSTETQIQCAKVMIEETDKATLRVTKYVNQVAALSTGAGVVSDTDTNITQILHQLVLTMCEELRKDTKTI